MRVRKTNRQRVRAGGTGRFWCRCDRQLVREAAKCPHCGARNGRRREHPTRRPAPLDLTADDLRDA